jgi:hypothetical protein
MPFFYNGFKSGLKLKDSYAKINHNFTGVNKYSPITNIVVSDGNATYTLANNRFVAGENVSVSEINNPAPEELFYDGGGSIDFSQNSTLDGGLSNTSTFTTTVDGGLSV